MIGEHKVGLVFLKNHIRNLLKVYARRYFTFLNSNATHEVEASGDAERRAI